MEINPQGFHKASYAPPDKVKAPDRDYIPVVDDLISLGEHVISLAEQIGKPAAGFIERIFLRFKPSKAPNLPTTFSAATATIPGPAGIVVGERLTGMNAAPGPGEKGGTSSLQSESRGEDAAEKPACEELALLLSKIERSGIDLVTPGIDAAGALGAYRYLIDPAHRGKKGEAPVDISFGGTRLFSIEPSEKYDMRRLDEDLTRWQGGIDGLGRDPDLLALAAGGEKNGSIFSMASYLGALTDMRGKENAIREFGILSDACREGKVYTGNFTGDHLAMLRALGENPGETGVREAFDFLLKMLKERSVSSIRTFLKLLEGGVDPASARKLYEDLPVPVGHSDYEKAAAIAIRDRWFPAQSDPASPQESSGEKCELEERYRKDWGLAWEDGLADYSRFKTFASNPGEFSRLGEIYRELCEAEGRKALYSMEAVELIPSRLKDDPGGLQVMKKLLEKHMRLEVAVELYRILEPAEPEEYEKTAGLFMDFRGSRECIGELMKPAGRSSLEDRVKILNSFLELQGNGYLDAYRRIRDVSKDGDDFTAKIAIYTDILKLYRGEKYHEKIRESALEFVAAQPKENNGDLRAFRDLTYSGVNASQAKCIFDSLPEPRMPGDFSKAAPLFQGVSWWNEKNVALMMKPAGNSTPAERIEIFKGIEQQVSRDLQYNDYDKSSARWKYERLHKLFGDSESFTETGRLCIELMGLCGKKLWDTYDDTPMKKGLEFGVKLRRQSPECFNVLLELVRSGVRYDAAKALYEALPQPVESRYLKEKTGLFEGKGELTPWHFNIAAKPVGDTTLDERLETLGILCGENDEGRGHYSYNELVTACRGDRAEFLRLKDFCREKVAELSRLGRNDEKGILISLLIKELRTKPDFAGLVMKQVREGMSVEAAQAIYRMLPKCATSDEYRELAALFPAGMRWDDTQINAVKTPFGETSLKERIDLYTGLTKRISAPSDRVSRYEAFKKHSDNDEDYLGLGKTCGEILSAYPFGDPWGERIDKFNEGIPFIKARLADCAENRSFFNQLVKEGFSFEKSRDIFNFLDKHVNHRKTIELFILLSKKGTAQKTQEEALKLLERPIIDETVDERSAALLKLIDKRGTTQEQLGEAVKDYELITVKRDRKETLAGSMGRFTAIAGSLSQVKYGSADEIMKSAREVFEWISCEMAKGAFGEQTVEGVTAQFCFDILEGFSIERAEIHASSPDANTAAGEFRVDEDFIDFGNFRLEKSSRRKPIT